MVNLDTRECLKEFSICVPDESFTLFSPEPLREVYLKPRVLLRCCPMFHAGMEKWMKWEELRHDGRRT